VDAVAALTTSLVEQGAFVVFLSTNQVFDGSKPHTESAAALSPRAQYGRQKAEAERFVGQYGNSTAIIRFTKILGPNQPLFRGWSEHLRKGEAIQPFSDMYFSPIPLSCVTSVLRLVLDTRLSGVLQVSGTRDVSYADAARIGAGLMRVSQDLVQPVETREKLPDSEPFPKNTTLDVSRLRADLGVEPPDVEWTIETAFAKPEVLGH